MGRYVVFTIVMAKTKKNKNFQAFKESLWIEDRHVSVYFLTPPFLFLSRSERRIVEVIKPHKYKR